MFLKTGEMADISILSVLIEDFPTIVFRQLNFLTTGGRGDYEDNADLSEREVEERWWSMRFL